MEAKKYKVSSAMSLFIQLIILLFEAAAITITLSNTDDKSFLGLFFVFHFCLGVWQMGDALMGSIMGSKWRQYYLASAICYLSFFMVSSYLYHQQHIIDFGNDILEYTFLIGFFIIPAIMGCFYTALCYKDLQAKMTIK